MSRYTDEIGNTHNTSDEYGTPATFLQPISRAVGGFDLDSASGAEEHTYAETTYTKEDDGLTSEWFGKVWCNPPFSEKEDWLKHALSEHRQGNTELILMLLPVDTSTGWFHQYVTKADVLWFKKGRLSFDGGSNWGASFGIMMAIYGDAPDELLKVLEHKGEVYRQNDRFQTSEQTELSEVA